MFAPEQKRKSSIPETHVRFDGEMLFEKMAGLEWIETDGLGGYASATVCGMHTRRYHGLLMCALNPPLGRFLFLSRMEEKLIADGEEFELATNRYPGTVSPQGWRLLRSFHIDPFPRFVFEAGGVRLEKTVFMMRGRQAVMVRYRALGPRGGELPADKRKSISLIVRPFFAFRGEHCLAREHGGLRATPLGGTLTVSLDGGPGIPDCVLHHDGWDFHPAACWYRNFEYEAERERGLDWREDLFSPGELVSNFSAGTASLLASVERQARVAVSRRHAPSLEKSWTMLRDQERERREALLGGFGGSTGAVRRLVLSADAFIVERGDGASVIAGYPWFGDWGRDAMISLPGLTV
ncbi:MAG: glycogen debranching enzyme N-terminal domain-containing protein, partial [bacterium]